MVTVFLDSEELELALRKWADPGQVMGGMPMLNVRDNHLAIQR
jgi:hypothetical protein